MVNIFQALAFYSLPGNYMKKEHDELGLMSGESAIEIDAGHQAREALDLLNRTGASISGLRVTRKEDYFTAIWEGRGYGKNEKLIRGQRKGGAGYIFRNKKYDDFMNKLSFCFKLNGKFISGLARVVMKISCHHSRDHHNFIEPVLDALQQSGCIENDRNVVELILPEPERHGNGVPDIIAITVQGLY